MENKKNSKANKPLRDEDKIKKNDLPYDPEINRDDMQALTDKELSMNQGRDLAITKRERPADFSGEDLDIPGRKASNTSQTGTDLPDEENYQFNKRGSKNRENQANKEIPDPDSNIS